MLKKTRVVVRGAGDLATGVIYNLFQAGFQVVATEIEKPLVVRRTVSLAEAVYKGEYTVEGITGQRVAEFSNVEDVLNQDKVPVVVDPPAEIVDFWEPQVLVDATMAKKNLGTNREDAEIVIGLGPGFTAQKDVDAVIETNRGHELGKIIENGQAQPNTGIPGEIAGYRKERVLKSPVAGEFTSKRKIGEKISAGEIFGNIGDEEIKAKIDGVIRGLLKPGQQVKAGTKLGDIDPRGSTNNCYTISDKARAIGGAVITAILSLANTS